MVYLVAINSTPAYIYVFFFDPQGGCRFLFVLAKSSYTFFSSFNIREHFIFLKSHHYMFAAWCMSMTKHQSNFELRSFWYEQGTVFVIKSDVVLCYYHMAFLNMKAVPSLLVYRLSFMIRSVPTRKMYRSIFFIYNPIFNMNAFVQLVFSGETPFPQHYQTLRTFVIVTYTIFRGHRRN